METLDKSAPFVGRVVCLLLSPWQLQIKQRIDPTVHPKPETSHTSVSHAAVQADMFLHEQQHKHLNISEKTRLSVCPLQRRTPNLKQAPQWNISKSTTCLYPTHNEDKLCMYAAWGDTKHYSKSIQPVGLCTGRWVTGSSSPPSLIKGTKRSCYSKACFCILCIVDQQRQPQLGCTVKSSESPPAFFDFGCSVSFLIQKSQGSRYCKVILIVDTRQEEQDAPLHPFWRATRWLGEIC